jgi:hypothetical protein
MPPPAAWRFLRPTFDPMATKKKPIITSVHKSGAGIGAWLGIAFLVVLVD